ncbi:MAG: class I SAM-dependent methyltransferase [Thermomicrobiales bacterium]
MRPHANQWDEYAAEYAQWTARRQHLRPEDNVILVRLLDLLGDVAGRTVLDACCGEGFLARILASRGACVTGIDLSPRLVQMARAKDPDGVIAYRVGDLSRPVPEFAGHFDAIGSYLALNDVADHRGFATTLATLAKSGTRCVLALNNPYSSVIRGHIIDYFASGTTAVYGGLSEAGVKVRYYHRTLEEYLDTFLAAGWRLVKLADIPDRAGLEWLLPEECRFPRFTVLAFAKE